MNINCSAHLSSAATFFSRSRTSSASCLPSSRLESAAEYRPATSPARYLGRPSAVFALLVVAACGSGTQHPASPSTESPPNAHDTCVGSVLADLTQYSEGAGTATGAQTAVTAISDKYGITSATFRFIVGNAGDLSSARVAYGRGSKQETAVLLRLQQQLNAAPDVCP